MVWLLLCSLWKKIKITLPYPVPPLDKNKPWQKTKPALWAICHRRNSKGFNSTTAFVPEHSGVVCVCQAFFSPRSFASVQDVTNFPLFFAKIRAETTWMTCKNFSVTYAHDIGIHVCKFKGENRYTRHACWFDYLLSNSLSVKSVWAPRVGSPTATSIKPLSHGRWDHARSQEGPVVLTSGAEGKIGN